MIELGVVEVEEVRRKIVVEVEAVEG